MQVRVTLALARSPVAGQAVWRLAVTAVGRTVQLAGCLCDFFRVSL